MTAVTSLVSAIVGIGSPVRRGDICPAGTSRVSVGTTHRPRGMKPGVLSWGGTSDHGCHSRKAVVRVQHKSGRRTPRLWVRRQGLESRTNRPGRWSPIGRGPLSRLRLSPGGRVRRQPSDPAAGPGSWRSPRRGRIAARRADHAPPARRRVRARYQITAPTAVTRASPLAITSCQKPAPCSTPKSPCG
jgi:hypothetical protein